MDIAAEAVRLADEAPALDRAGAHIWRTMTAAALHDPAGSLEDGSLALADARRTGAEIWELLASVVHLWGRICAPTLDGEDAHDARVRCSIETRELTATHAALHATGVLGLAPLLGCLVAEALHAAGEPEDARQAAAAAIADAARTGTVLWARRLAAAARRRNAGVTHLG